MIEITCPHCDKMHSVRIDAVVPPEQELSVTIRSESPFIAAEAVGGIITNTAKLLHAVAKDVGEQVSVFVKDIKVIEQEVSVAFIVTAKKAKEKT